MGAAAAAAAPAVLGAADWAVVAGGRWCLCLRSRFVFVMMMICVLVIFHVFGAVFIVHNQQGCR